MIKGERIVETQWHNLIIWGEKATLAENYLKKGDEIVIEGKLANRNYVDKDGFKHYATEIIVNEFLKLNGKAS